MPYDLSSEFFSNAIKREVNVLSSQNTWKVVLTKYVPQKATDHSERFVSSIKEGEMPYQIWKARFVVWEHKDIMKPFPSQNISFAREHSTTINVSLSDIFPFRSFCNVAQAYLQSKKASTRHWYKAKIQMYWNFQSLCKDHHKAVTVENVPSTNIF